MPKYILSLYQMKAPIKAKIPTEQITRIAWSFDFQIGILNQECFFVIVFYSFSIIL